MSLKVGKTIRTLKLPNFKIRTNEPKIWKNNKNTETLSNLSGSYKNKTYI